MMTLPVGGVIAGPRAGEREPIRIESGPKFHREDLQQSTLRVGSRVIAQRTTGVCDAGERGVCYEEYTLPDGKGGRRSGWSFIFESGRHDGFSPEEVEMMLEMTGEVCREVADYEFTNALRLMTDFRRGYFAPAFP